MGVVKFCDHVNNGGRVTTSLTYTPVKFWKSHAYDGLLMLMTVISGEEPTFTSIYTQNVSHRVKNALDTNSFHAVCYLRKATAVLGRLPEADDPTATAASVDNMTHLFPNCDPWNTSTRRFSS